MINKVILLGNVGRDPETRFTQGGAQITNISLATTRNYKDGQGQKQQETEWHHVCFFGKLAEIVGQYAHKGSRLYIEGRIKTRKWQDQSGQDRYTTEIIGEEMKLLDSRQEGNQAAPRQSTQQRPSQAASAPPTEDDFDDLIPFADMPKLLAKHHLI